MSNPIIAPKTVGITLLSPMIAQDTPQYITNFIMDLQPQKVAAKTVTSYRSDLLGFAHWFTGSTDEAYTASAVTPSDVRDYWAHLRTIQRRPAATVNRRLAALRRFFSWAKATLSRLPITSSSGTVPKVLVATNG